MVRNVNSLFNLFKNYYILTVCFFFIGVADKKSSEEVYICGYYLDNRCVNYEKCNNYHPPYRLPYCWIYKDLNGATKICPKKKDLEIEKAFCQADKEKYIRFVVCLFEIHFIPLYT